MLLDAYYARVSLDFCRKVGKDNQHYQIDQKSQNVRDNHHQILSLNLSIQSFT